MNNRGSRLASTTLKLRLASVAAVLVFAATLLVTLSTLSVAERRMKAVIGDQQYSLLAGAAPFMDSLGARLGQVRWPPRFRRACSATGPAWARFSPNSCASWAPTCT
jgi:hypothetical protein